MIAILSLLVPVALYGFNAYLFNAYQRGGIFYGFSGRLWRWKRKADRDFEKHTRAARSFYLLREKYRKAVVIKKGDIAYPIIKDAGYYEGYLIRTVREDGSTIEFKNFTGVDPNGRPDDPLFECVIGSVDFVVLEDNFEEQTRIYEGVFTNGTKIADQYRRDANFRKAIITPLVICPDCGLFWYSLPAFEIMRQAATFSEVFSLDWASYPLYLFAAFAIQLYKR